MFNSTRTRRVRVEGCQPILAEVRSIGDSDYRWVMTELARPVDSAGLFHESSSELENKLDVDAHRINVGKHVARGNVLIDYLGVGR